MGNVCIWWLVYFFLRHCQQYFSYIFTVSFIGGNWSTWRKSPTYRKSLWNFSHNVVSSTPRLSEVRTHNYHTITTAPAMYMKTVYRFWLFYNWSIFNSFHNKITWIVSDCFLTSSEQPVFALTTWCCIRSGSSEYQFYSFWFHLTMFRTHKLPH